MQHRRSLLNLEASRRAVVIYSILGSMIVAGVGFALYKQAGDSNDAAAVPAGQEQGYAFVAPSAPLLPSGSVPPSASASPSAKSASPSVSPSRKRTVQSRGGGACALPAYPTENCAGVPRGWSPKKTQQGDLTITKAGTVISDYLVTGSIQVMADNVTIRRTRVYGTVDNFHSDRIHGHLTIEDTEVVNPPGKQFSTNEQYAFGVANYTCRRCKVVNRMEGWRIGARSFSGAAKVTIEDSYARLAVPPGMCSSADPHGDGIQGYGAPTAVIRHNTIDQRQDDCPTAPIFIPDQDNSGGTVEDNMLAGGGYALRLTGGSFSSVAGNKIVEGSAYYGPVEVDCGKIRGWTDNAIVTFDWSTGKIIKEVKKLNDCG